MWQCNHPMMFLDTGNVCDPSNGYTWKNSHSPKPWQFAYFSVVVTESLWSNSALYYRVFNNYFFKLSVPYIVPPINKVKKSSVGTNIILDLQKKGVFNITHNSLSYHLLNVKDEITKENIVLTTWLFWVVLMLNQLFILLKKCTILKI